MKLFRLEKLTINCADFSGGIRWKVIAEADDLEELEVKVLEKGAEAHAQALVYSMPTNGRGVFDMFRIIPANRSA